MSPFKKSPPATFISKWYVNLTYRVQRNRYRKPGWFFLEWVCRVLYTVPFTHKLSMDDMILDFLEIYYLLLLKCQRNYSSMDYVCIMWCIFATLEC